MAYPAIAIQELSLEERVKTGCSHRAIIDYTDLTDTAGTAKTLVLLPYQARDLFNVAFFDLVSGFVGPSITNLTIELGWNGAAVDDPNGLIEAAELATAGTEILAGDATGVAFATKRTGFAAQEAGNIEAVLTSTGANLSVLTAGKVFVYLNRVRLNDSALRPLSAP